MPNTVTRFAYGGLPLFFIYRPLPPTSTPVRRFKVLQRLGKYFFLRSAKKKPLLAFSARHGSTAFPAPSQRNPVWFKMGIFCHRSSTGKSLSTSLPCNPFDRLRVVSICLKKQKSKKAQAFFPAPPCQGKSMDLSWRCNRKNAGFLIDFCNRFSAKRTIL